MTCQKISKLRQVTNWEPNIYKIPDLENSPEEQKKHKAQIKTQRSEQL